MAHFKKLLFCSERNVYMMKLWLRLKHRVYTKENLFKWLCIENDFAKNFAECRNLFKHFVSHITVIPWKDAIL